LSRQHSGPGGHLRMHQVADSVVLSQSATTRLVSRLEDRGLLNRYICDTDRRGIYTDVSEAGLALLAEQAYRRGCTVVAVAPARTPLAETLGGSHGLFVPMSTAPYDQEEPQPLAATAPGVLWALLTPLLALLDRTGLLAAPPDVLDRVADRLDRVAERCGPAIATYSNPAKTLAAELADALPLVWTEGVSAGPAGRRFAAALAELS
ncbi:MarR family transcriptional regulator, partial [Streptomyces sp. G35A]